MLLGHLLDAQRETQILEPRDLVGDDAEGERRGAALLEAVHTEAREVGRHVGGVELARLAKGDQPVRRACGHFLEHGLELGLAERRPAFERGERAVAADDRRQAELQVDVRAAAVDDSAQECVQVHTKAPSAAL